MPLSKPIKYHTVPRKKRSCCFSSTLRQTPKCQTCLELLGDGVWRRQLVARHLLGKIRETLTGQGRPVLSCQCQVILGVSASWFQSMAQPEQAQICSVSHGDNHLSMRPSTDAIGLLLGPDSAHPSCGSETLLQASSVPPFISSTNAVQALVAGPV